MAHKANNTVSKFHYLLKMGFVPVLKNQVKDMFKPDYNRLQLCYNKVPFGIARIARQAQPPNHRNPA